MQRYSSEDILRHFQYLHPEKIVLSTADVGEEFSHHYDIVVFDDMPTIHQYLQRFVGKSWLWVGSQDYDSKELWTESQAIVDLSTDKQIDIITYKSYGYRLKFADPEIYKKLKEYFQEGSTYISHDFK